MHKITQEQTKLINDQQQIISNQISEYFPNITSKNETSRFKRFLLKILQKLVIDNKPFQPLNIISLFTSVIDTQEYDETILEMYKKPSTIECCISTLDKIALSPQSKKIYGENKSTQLHDTYISLKARLKKKLTQKTSQLQQNTTNHEIDQKIQKKTTKNKKKLNDKQKENIIENDDSTSESEDDFTQPVQHNINEQSPQNTTINTPNQENNHKNEQNTYPPREMLFKPSTQNNETIQQHNNDQTPQHTKNTKTIRVMTNITENALNLIRNKSLNNQFSDNKLIAEIIDNFVFPTTYTMEIIDE